ncbi:putative AC transposase [Phytophthora citrophthora]|uniref:AC transposase n=1 Tax=Phytophthora citrophthora TaxID=4793 RepID=A0AAD9GRY2_9STRA|nr:putative AC transposase [Phytophthora citrophthora]
MEKELVRKTLIRECIGCRTSMTTDMWTSAAKRGYMVVTLHWMSLDWIMRSVILGFKRVEYPHTGIRLADHFLDVIMEMDGELLKSVWAITTDNASNNGTMVDTINNRLPNQLRQQMEINIASSAAVETSAAINDTEPLVVFQVHCMAHVLQLAVKAGLQKCPFVDSSIGDVRDILKKIAESPSLLEGLKSVCEALQISFRIPELDCVTRWNSTWDMVSTAIKLRKPVEELQRRIRERHTGYTEFKIGPDSRLARELSTDTWDALSQFHRFLTPVKAATTMMSGKNYPTFGMAVVVFDMISKHATKVVRSATSQYTVAFATAFEAKLDAYKEAVKTREAKIAAVLDPRAKQLVQSGDADMEPFKRCVCDEYESKYRPTFEAQQHESRTPQRSPQEEQDAELYEALNDLIDDSYGIGAPTTFDGEPFSSELDRWLAHRDKPMHSKTKSREVCKWMRSVVGFPRIQLMARDFLAVMATSVPSEQAFSAAGSTVSVTRARLGDEAVQAVSEMQSFLKFNKATEKLLSDVNDSEGE